MDHEVTECLSHTNTIDEEFFKISMQQQQQLPLILTLRPLLIQYLT